MTTESIFTRDADGTVHLRPVGPNARLEELERRIERLEREVAKLPDKAAAQVSRELSAALHAARTDRG